MGKTSENVLLTYDSLEDFGLSSYEAKVYLTMLKLGLSTARKISDVSNVPFGRIYDVLRLLENKGLVDKQSSRPKKFIAKEPKIALKNLLAIKKEELQLLTEKASVIEEKLTKLYVRNPEEGLFWSVALEGETMAHLNDKILETENELLIFLNVQIKHIKKEVDYYLLDFVYSLEELLKRGVTIKILLGGISDINQLKDLIISFSSYYEIMSDIPIRMTNILTNTFDIIDEEKVLLKISNPINLEEYFALIYVRQKQFATQLRKKYLKMWQEAKEIDENELIKIIATEKQ